MKALCGRSICWHVAGQRCKKKGGGGCPPGRVQVPVCICCKLVFGRVQCHLSRCAIWSQKFLDLFEISQTSARKFWRENGP